MACRKRNNASARVGQLPDVPLGYAADRLNICLAHRPAAVLYHVPSAAQCTGGDLTYRMNTRDTILLTW